MKTLTIDFKEYKRELEEAFEDGYRAKRKEFIELCMLSDLRPANEVLFVAVNHFLGERIETIEQYKVDLVMKAFGFEYYSGIIKDCKASRSVEWGEKET